MMLGGRVLRLGAILLVRCPLRTESSCRTSHFAQRSTAEFAVVVLVTGSACDKWPAVRASVDKQPSFQVRAPCALPSLRQSGQDPVFVTPQLAVGLICWQFNGISQMTV